MGRQNAADDLLCSRFHALAWTAFRAGAHAVNSIGSAVPPLGSFIVVLDGCNRGGHPRNSVGTLVAYRPRVTKGRGRCVELFTIRTPRGVLRRWTNCVLFLVPDTAEKGGGR